MENAIAKDFTFSSLLRFSAPTIIMMVFMSLYTIVDGVFVSRFVGTNALSAINIVYPVINIVIAVAIMLATGGSAVIARKMGEGRHEEARRDFSTLVLTGILAGAALGAAGILFMKPLVAVLGASEALEGYCYEYLFVLSLFAPASVLQMLFQTFFVTAGKPKIGLLLTVIAGVVNAVFDYIFIVPLQMGIRGAALATAMGYMIPALYGLIYFFRTRGALYFMRPVRDWHMLAQSCLNGSSEMVTNLSTGVVTYLFNIIMMKYLQEDGVAAITIVMYAQFLLTALYLGFSQGVAPVISYNHGSGNTPLLRRIFRYCMTFLIASSVLVLAVSFAGASPIVSVFAGKGSAVYDITVSGFVLFSINYLFAGINIFSSSMFTAFSNGKVSALISFLRTFVFIVIGMVFLPRLLGVNGVWLAVPFAEAATVFVSVFYLYRGREIYHYAG